MKQIKQIRSKIILVLMLAVMVTGIGVISAKGDMGPKPSVVISIEGINEKEYWVTLLSEKQSAGPYSVEKEPYYENWIEDEKNEYWINEYKKENEIWWKFKNFEDTDGYYFIGYMEECSEDNIFRWGYYPPEKFKVLIYIPEKDKMIECSTICEKYAFDSYYTLKIDGKEYKNSDIDIDNSHPDNEYSDDDYIRIEGGDVRKNYDFIHELISFGVRVLFTIITELVIALMFMYTKKNQLMIIGITNIVTQIILNVLINLLYNLQMAKLVFDNFTPLYLLLEIVVFWVEGMVYARKLTDDEHDKKYCVKKAYIYSAVANIVSFLAGIWIMWDNLL